MMEAFNRFKTVGGCMTLALLLFAAMSIDSVLGNDEYNTKEALCPLYNISLEDCTCVKHKFICDLLSTSTVNSPVPNPPITRRYCDQTMQYVRAISYTFLGTVGILGNGLVIIVSMHSWMTTRCHFLITILAAVDLSKCTLELIMNIPFFWSCQWVYGQIVCKLTTCLLNSSSLVAMGLILMVTVERYLGVVHPFRSRVGMSRRQMYILLSLNLALGVGMAVPIYIYTSVGEFNLCQEVWPTWWQSFVYTLVVLVFFTFVPAVVLVVLYWRITKTLKATTYSLMDKKNVIPSQSEARRIKNNERITRVCISISVLFVILVFPNRILWIAREIIVVGSEGHVSQTFQRLFVGFGFILYSCHAVVNPFIYSLMDRSFRKRVSSLLSCNTISKNQSKVWSSVTRRTRNISRLSSYRKDTHTLDTLQETIIPSNQRSCETMA